MRYTRRKKALGDIRKKTYFLIFPKTIGEETRWLERATVVEKVVTVQYGYDYGLEWEESHFEN